MIRNFLEIFTLGRVPFGSGFPHGTQQEIRGNVDVHIQTSSTSGNIAPKANSQQVNKQRLNPLTDYFVEGMFEEEDDDTVSKDSLSRGGLSRRLCIHSFLLMRL